MIINLGEETLRSGEKLKIVCVNAPESEFSDQIRPFLGHKGPNYSGHVVSALAGKCDDLETRFYIGLIDGEMMANIMTCEAKGAGILGHVHTREDQRRKGICAHVMRHQMNDFKARDGKILLLGTGYKSTAYNIYESFGFKDWTPHLPGLMRYESPDYAQFVREYFTADSAVPKKAMWKHWPLAAFLSSVPSDVYLRSIHFNVWGVGLLEGPYCRFQFENREDSAAAVLESKSGYVTAVATRIPDSRWQGKVDLLDIFSHQSVTAKQISALLESLEVPDKPVQCYADPRDISKIEALEMSGFKKAAVLPDQFCESGKWHDALLFAKPAG